MRPESGKGSAVIHSFPCWGRLIDAIKPSDSRFFASAVRPTSRPLTSRCAPRPDCSPPATSPKSPPPTTPPPHPPAASPPLASPTPPLTAPPAVTAVTSATDGAWVTITPPASGCAPEHYELRYSLANYAGAATHVVTLPPGVVSRLLSLWPGETYTVSAVGVCSGGATTPPSPQVVFTTRSLSPPPPKTRLTAPSPPPSPPPPAVCPWPATTPKCIGDACVVEVFAAGFAKLDLHTGAVTMAYQPGAVALAVPPYAASGVSAIYSCGSGVVAVKNGNAQRNTSFYAWGTDDGLFSSNVSSSFPSATNVSSCSCTLGALAILTTEGHAWTFPFGTLAISGGQFGDNFGANSSAVAADLQGGIVALYSTAGAYAALSGNGSLVVWGNETLGGSAVDATKNTSAPIIAYSTVAAKLAANVSAVYATAAAFAAVHKDGSCTTW